jgi:hypothetical protein
VGSIVAILLVMSVLDLVYTKIYETCYPRTKFQYLRSLKNKKVDYIFVGSSRVDSGIVPSIIHIKTGKEAVNLGFQAAKLGDVYTILQLIKEYNLHYETIFIQVDYIYNFVGGNSTMFQYEMMPFVRENLITKAYSDAYSANPIASYYIPFYRYCDNDLKIGFREIFSNLINKRTAIVSNRGFTALEGNSIKLEGSLPGKILDNNHILDSIRSFSRQNKMEVVFYCAPVCKNSKNKNFTSKLKKKIPGFIDFSTVIHDDTMFLNCNHLNGKGARQFTEILIEQLLKK